jgi:hypothetical protein
VRDQGPRRKKMHDALAVNGDFPRGKMEKASDYSQRDPEHLHCNERAT